jgi:hypothetical protein
VSVYSLTLAKSAAVGDIITAQGDILEDEVNSLAKIDSGLTLDTSEDYVGTAMVAGELSKWCRRRSRWRPPTPAAAMARC